MDVPWLCMPQKSWQAKQRLGEAFRVEQCPMLVVIDPDGNVVTTEGVETMDYRCRYCCVDFSGAGGEIVTPSPWHPQFLRSSGRVVRKRNQSSRLAPQAGVVARAEHGRKKATEFITTPK